MDGRKFLDSARRVYLGNTQADWRTAAGRAYYALLIECRDAMLRWGFKPPPRDKIHHFVRLSFTYAALREVKQLGLQLERLGRLRSSADYDTSTVGPFGNGLRAQQAVKDSQDAIALLDQIEADPARRTATINAVAAAIPP
jgi:hypothetical protein